MTSLSDIELAGALRALSGMIRSGDQGLSADRDRNIVQNTLFRWLDADLGEGHFIRARPAAAAGTGQSGQGLDVTRPILAVLDGSKALRRAVLACSTGR